MGCPFLLFWWPIVGRHSFMAKSCGDDMTKPNFLRGTSSDSAVCEPGRVRSSRVCPAKGGVHIVHTFVHGRLFGLHFGPFLMVLPSLLHAVLCFRRHDFAAQTVGFVGRSGFSGNLFGISVAGVRAVDSVKVCGIRTLLQGSSGPRRSA